MNARPQQNMQQAVAEGLGLHLAHLPTVSTEHMLSEGLLNWCLVSWLPEETEAALQEVVKMQVCNGCRVLKEDGWTVSPGAPSSVTLHDQHGWSGLQGPGP